MPPHSPYKRLRRGRAISPIARYPLNLQQRLPVELIYDIFGYLAPIDLLHLSRVQVQFRLLVLGKHTTTDKLWRDALSAVAGLPPCPQWLSPPRYASLCFEKHCDVCLDDVSDDVQKTFWEFFSRYCDKCAPLMLSSNDPFEGLRQGRHGRVCHSHLTLPSVVLPIDEQHYGVFFHNKDVEQVRTSLMSADGHLAKMTVLIDRRAQTRERKDVALQCRAWKEVYAHEEKQRLGSIQRNRRNTIMNRMVGLGFRDEVEGLGLFRDGLSGDARRLVMQPRELDESEWNGIKCILTCFLNERRALQSRINARDLQRTRLAFLEEAVSSYRDCLDTDAMCPHAADLAGCVEVRTIVELECDPGNVLSPTAFRRLVPRLAERWKAGVEAQLLAISPQLSSGQTLAAVVSIPRRTPRHAIVTPPPLALACAGFKCSSCNYLLSPSTVFFHPCCYPQTNSWESTVNDEQYLDGRLPKIDVDTYENACLVQFRGRLPWTSSPLVSISPTIERIVKASGEDPTQCTPQILDRKNIHLACALCSHKRARVVVMGWRRAVQHAEEVHPEQSPKWTRVPSVIEQKVVDLEYHRRNLIPADIESQAFWECVACDFPKFSSGADPNRSAQSVMRHAEQKHLDGPFRKYLYKSADSLPHYHPEIVIVSSHLRSDDASKEKTLAFMKLPDGW